MQRGTFPLFARAPHLFFLFQSATLPLVLLERDLDSRMSLTKDLDWGTRGLVVFYVVLSLVLSQIITAGVLLLVKALSESRPKPALTSLRTLGNELLPLLSATFLVAVVVSVGIFAYIVPGVLFLALYAFVPHNVVTRPGERLMVYFSRSWKLARQRFFSILLVFALALVAVQGIDLFGAKGTWGYSRHLALGLAWDFVGNILIGALLNVWLASLFLTLTEPEEK